MRGLRVARQATPGWSVQWDVEDRYKLLPAGAQVGVRYTDFTVGADAYAGEAWVSPGTYHGTPAEAWLPRIMVRRRGSAPLATTFVSLIEPYGQAPAIAHAQRLRLLRADGSDAPDSSVALRIRLPGGGQDLLICNASADLAVVQPDTGLNVTGRLCLVRTNADHQVEMLALCGGSAVTFGQTMLRLDGEVDFVQIRGTSDGGAAILHGPAERIKQLQLRTPAQPR